MREVSIASRATSNLAHCNNRVRVKFGVIIDPSPYNVPLLVERFHCQLAKCTEHEESIFDK